MMSGTYSNLFKNVALPVFLVGATVPDIALADKAAAERTVHRYVDFNILSVHDPFDRERVYYRDDGGEKKNFNEKNWGIGYTQLHDITHFMDADLRIGGSVGYYKNSYSKDSFYASTQGELAYKLHKDWTLSVGMMAGVVTGYDHVSGYKATPAGQMYLRGEYADKYSVKLGYMPELAIKDRINPELITLQASIKF
jgi:hypothetical protein